jgi:hypothetical protein
VLNALLVSAVSVGIAAGGLGLNDRVLRQDELHGFRAADVRTASDADAWEKLAPSALVDVANRVRREGFVAAVREDLAGSSGDRGALSIVVRLRNARAASAEIARQLRDYATEGTRLHGHTYAPFTVAGIPGAHGFTSNDPNGGTGVNVIFADGAFAYHVDAGWAKGAKTPPTRAAVVRAAAHLYARVHGR